MRRADAFSLLVIGMFVACASSPEPPSEPCGSAERRTIADHLVKIRPGQTLCVELEVAGSTVTPTAVVSATDPADVLYLRFSRESHGVFLKVQNPLPAPLKYQARMRLPGEADLRNTNSCPIMPGRSVFESWPHDVEELVLGDFRLLPDSDGSMVCN